MEDWQQLTIGEHMKFLEEQGITGKEAMKLAASQRGISRRDVYQYLLNEKQ